MAVTENNTPFITDFDNYLFHQGTNYEAYRKLGAHMTELDGVAGTLFALWAPNARRCAVITARTGWGANEYGMNPRADGFWDLFLPGVGDGDAYRFVVTGADGIKRYKSDPFGFRTEKRPDSASIVCRLDTYPWVDDDWQAMRDNAALPERPLAVYELHLAAWKKRSLGDWDPDGFLNYREIAEQLAEYAVWTGFTHVALSGVCEYPDDSSWGSQVSGFFAPTARYGTPDDFRYLVDTLHQAGVGVILDWAPAHFPKDSWGLERFDGTCLYEPEDPLRREYPAWDTLAFAHGKPEIRSFLISSAFYWIREFHIDALRVSAVASMLSAAYGRTEWRPNLFGGDINLESRDFLQQLSTAVCGQTTGWLIAEDSSAVSGVTSDVRYGGIGFSCLWNTDWMDDALRYLARDPVRGDVRREGIVRTADYAFAEQYILALRHEATAQPRHPLSEQPTGAEHRLDALKTLYTHLFTYPGKKLLFMGQEFGQERAWSLRRELEWWLCNEPNHRDVLLCVRRLLELYRTWPCLHEDFKDPAVFEWVSLWDAERAATSYIRRGRRDYGGALLVVCSFSPDGCGDYTVGVPLAGEYRRVFSTYDTADAAPPVTEACGRDGFDYALRFPLRPFESVIFAFPTPEALP